jgi:diguanylate cyclase (GGDEF)-like protein
MIRLLMVEDHDDAAELTLRALRLDGLPCACERVVNEVEFRKALDFEPDLILSDSNIPGFDGFAALSIAKAERPATPFIFVSGHFDAAVARRALEAGAVDCVAKSELARLPPAVRLALEPSHGRLRRTTDRGKPAAGALDPNDTATHLLERREALDRTLLPREDSTLSGILSRTPPIPVAMLMIKSDTTRERYVKVLSNAEIEIEVIGDSREAIDRLAEHVHAVLFTDQLDLVREARQLEMGSATHIVFVDRGGTPADSEALRAGANEIVPADARGERFWAHMTIVRRLVSFADSLQSAVTGNRILSTIDELTRCGNRRFFEQQFPREVARAMRLRRPLSLLMCDIDHFKLINDRNGHQTGDEVLREFGERITNGLRLGQDWAARIGGEEFAIILPETGQSEAVAIAQRLCDRVSAHAFITAAAAITVTASFGTCGVRNPTSEWTSLAEGMVLAADSALYESKRSGRNRVTDGTTKINLPPRRS